MLDYNEYNIINAMIKRKRPLTAKQLTGHLIGSSEKAVIRTINKLLEDDMIRDPKKDGHYVITVSGWNAWDHYNNR
jgi:predicted transcriptional regulator